MLRRKAETDRDKALARQLAGRASPPPGASAFPDPAPSNRTNAFDRIRGRSLQSSRPPGRTDHHVKQESKPTLATRPRVSTGGGHGPFVAPGDDNKVEEHRYHVPGAYEDFTDEFEDLGTVASLAGPSRAQLPSVPSSNGLGTVLPPTLSASRQLVGPPVGYETTDTLGYAPNIPAIELARQASMVRQQAGLGSLSSGWPPVGPIGQQLQTPLRNFQPSLGLYQPTLGQNPPSWPSLGTDRPGSLSNGSYYSQSAQPVAPPSLATSSLAATIGRVNGYDFNAMLDAEGNPLSSRLVDFLDDYVNDPRKTEEEIKQLLANIRPDMEIPEEERGETPEAMKYPLYLHQQLALKWMTDMEEGTNKGGILADDMGLGKTISTLALMISRPSSDNIKVCDPSRRIHGILELTALTCADQPDHWPRRPHQAMGARGEKETESVS